MHSLAFAPFADSAGPASGFSPPPSPAPASAWAPLQSRPPPAAHAGHDLLRLAIGASDAARTRRESLLGPSPPLRLQQALPGLGAREAARRTVDESLITR